MVFPYMFSNGIIQRERERTLTVEVSQAVSLAVVTTNCEKSAEAIVARKFL